MRAKYVCRSRLNFEITYKILEHKYSKNFKVSYMFHTVHCSIIPNENQQNAQIIYISSICNTYKFRSLLTTIRVRCYTV